MSQKFKRGDRVRTCNGHPGPTQRGTIDGYDYTEYWWVNYPQGRLRTPEKMLELDTPRVGDRVKMVAQEPTLNDLFLGREGVVTRITYAGQIYVRFNGEHNDWYTFAPNLEVIASNPTPTNPRWEKGEFILGTQRVRACKEALVALGIKDPRDDGVYEFKVEVIQPAFKAGDWVRHEGKVGRISSVRRGSVATVDFPGLDGQEFPFSSLEAY